MINKPNFIIIGSSVRNVGKTEMACRIIQRYASVYKMIGIKISVLQHAEDDLEKVIPGGYKLIEENDIAAIKDTSRMLQAGVYKAYRLIAQNECLEDGINALIREIPDDIPVVCESTSARHFIEPSLFLLITAAGESDVKSSYKKLFECADIIVGFSNRTWDFDPEQIVFCKGGWSFQK